MITAEEIKKNIDYKAFYSTYITNIKINGKDKVLCHCPLPGHPDKKKSFLVNMITGQFKCFSCVKDGDVFDFIGIINSVDFKTALNSIAGSHCFTDDNVNTKKTHPVQEKKKPDPNFLSTKQINLIHKQLLNNSEAYTKLQKDRGLSPKTIKEYSIGYQNDRYVFPIEIKKGKWTIKEHKGSQTLGGTAVLYPSSILEKNHSDNIIFLVEGEFDALKCIQEGIPAVTGTGGASTWLKEWNEKFKELHVIVGYDNDLAGKQGTKKIITNLKEYTESVSKIRWPSWMDSKKCKDAGDYLKRKSISDLKKLIANAKEYNPENNKIEVAGISFNKSFESDDLIFNLPDGFGVSNNSLYRFDKNDKGIEIAYHHVSNGIPYIFRRFQDIDTKIVRVNLRYRKSKSILVETAEINTKHKICKLANYDFPVYEENAKMWINYFYHFGQKNQGILEPLIQCSNNGWKTIGREKVFILGDRCFSSKTGEKVNVKLEPSDSNLLRQKEALEPNGSFSKWEKVAVEIINNYTIPAFSLIATFCSPLLELINQSNFIIDISGRTSAGKTAVNQIAASVWGKPTEGDLLLGTFTSVGVENQFYFFDGMGVFLQDIHKEDNAKHIEKIAYMVADGAGKVRGTKTGGNRKVLRFKGVSFTTGEIGFADLVKYEGSIARTIRFTEFPFYLVNEETGKKIKKYKDILSENYGHAGIKWLNFITAEMKAPQFIEHLKDSHAINEKQFNIKNSIPGASRMVSYFATIMITAKLLSECFKWDLDKMEDQIIKGFNKATEATEDNLPKYQKAFMAFRSWVGSNKSKFIHEGEKSMHYKNTDNERYGIFFEGSEDKDGFVAVYPGIMRKFFKDYEFPKSILKTWKDKGWLVCDSGRQTSKIRTRRLIGSDIEMGLPPYERFIRIPWSVYNNDNI